MLKYNHFIDLSNINLIAFILLPDGLQKSSFLEYLLHEFELLLGILILDLQLQDDYLQRVQGQLVLVQSDVRICLPVISLGVIGIKLNRLIAVRNRKAVVFQLHVGVGSVREVDGGFWGVQLHGDCLSVFVNGSIVFAGQKGKLWENRKNKENL